MSALDHIRSVSETVLHDGWDQTPIAYDSVRFDSAKQDDFIRHTLLTGDSFQSGMPACIRYSGVVAINVFTAQNKGTAKAYSMADAINELFALKNIDGVRFYSGTVTRVGFTEDYFQLSIFINYQYDKIA